MVELRRDREEKRGRGGKEETEKRDRLGRRLKLKVGSVKDDGFIGREMTRTREQQRVDMGSGRLFQDISRIL